MPDWEYYNKKKGRKPMSDKERAHLWFRTFRLLAVLIGIVVFVLWFLAIIFWYGKLTGIGFLMLIPMAACVIASAWQYQVYDECEAETQEKYR